MVRNGEIPKLHDDAPTPEAPGRAGVRHGSLLVGTRGGAFLRGSDCARGDDAFAVSGWTTDDGATGGASACGGGWRWPVG